MSDPLETSELLAFTRTVDARSLSRAAVELGIPRATISRRLARLEQRLATRLLRRSTRSLVLTDAGVTFYQHARSVLDAVAQAEASVRRDDDLVRGEVRVSLPPIPSASLNDMLCTFAAQHPGVKLHVHVATEHVDLRRDGYDVALRAGLTLEPGLVARTLQRAPLLAVASPAYLEARGTPRTARDLRTHDCLLGFARGQVPQTHWPLVTGKRIRLEGAFTSNSLDLLCAAAIRGRGIALLPGILVAEPIARGELAPVLPGIIGTESRLAVVWVERELVPPAVRAFVDALIAWAPEGLLDPSPFRRPVSARPAPHRERATKPKRSAARRSAR